MPHFEKNCGAMTVVLSELKPRFESELQAYSWYCSEALPGFSGRTAMQLVNDGQADEVLAYISALDAGVHA